MADVERYKCLSNIEALYTNPDVQIGGPFGDITMNYMHTFDLKSKRPVIKEHITYSTPISKIFDEILVNAVDAHIRNEGVKHIDVTITDTTVTVRNDGNSIPIDVHPKYNVHVPELIFTTLNSGTNFDKKEATGGKNGIGAKLAAIYSKSFIIDIVNKRRRYYQTIEDATRVKHPPEITPTREQNYVSITYTPNIEVLTKGDRTTFSNGDVDYMYSRVYDMSTYDIELTLNGYKLKHLSWSEFVKSFEMSDAMFHFTNDNWYISIGLVKNRKFKRLSYVNDVATYNGGTHLKLIASTIYDTINNIVKPKLGSDVKKSIVTGNVAIVCKCILAGAAYSSQSKHELRTPTKLLPVPNITSFVKDFYVRTPALTELIFGKSVDKPVDNRSRSNPNIIEGYLPALRWKRESEKCTLFICEGLSAKTMCVAGIRILGGNNYYGCYPVGGKILNARASSQTQYVKNQHLNELKSIIGLVDGMLYDNENVNTLHYRHVVCVKDADSDGASIMGLIINFFASKFTTLLTCVDNFFYEFISPMVKVYTKDGLREFYNEYEYGQFMESVEQSFVRDVKFIKGLAANEDKDVKRYFEDYNDNRLAIMFTDGGETNSSHDVRKEDIDTLLGVKHGVSNPFEQTFDALDMVFAKDRTDERKDWLTTITPSTHLPRHKAKPIKCYDFVHADLVLFSYDACVRMIPSMIDGLKPVQRKVLYTLFERFGSKAYTPLKVFQLGGSVADFAQYHHGDQSMNEAIIGMTQDYVGSNNIPLLLKNGNTGTRISDGNDHGAPRYVGASLQHITRLIFPPVDDELLKRNVEDGEVVEPMYYVPIIPMVFVNGGIGIGVGWKSDMSAYNPTDLINMTRHYIDFRKYPNVELKPWYRGFKGDVVRTDNGYEFRGIVEQKDDKNFVVTEVPVPNYGFDKLEHKFKELVEKGVVDKFEYVVGDEISFPVRFKNSVNANSVTNVLELIQRKPFSGLVAFNTDGQITQYPNEIVMFNEWAVKREELYQQRHEMIVQRYESDILKLRNKVRFVDAMTNESLASDLSTMSNAEVNEYLTNQRYDMFGDSFAYLLDIPARQLSRENIERMKREMSKLESECETYKRTTIEDIWLSELQTLEDEWNTLRDKMDAADRGMFNTKKSKRRH